MLIERAKARRLVRRRRLELARQAFEHSISAGATPDWAAHKAERAHALVVLDWSWLVSTLGTRAALSVLEHAAATGAPWPDAQRILVECGGVRLRSSLVPDLESLAAALSALSPEVAARVPGSASAVPELRLALLDALEVPCGQVRQLAAALLAGQPVPVARLLALAAAVLAQPPARAGEDLPGTPRRTGRH